MQYPFMNVYVQFLAMVYVGLLGGAMYVNVFYLLVQKDANPIPEEDRELCINLVATFMTVGIVTSSIFEIIFDKVTS